MKSCIILCGGQSRRMGQDKGLMVYPGEPMILQVLETVQNIADEIVLILRDENQLNKYKEILDDLDTDSHAKLNIYTDKVPDQGPMVGICTGLVHVNSDYALVVPCDSPFLRRSFLKKLFTYVDEIDKFDAIVPRWSDGRLEPLHSIYQKRVVSNIKNLLNDGKRDVKSLLLDIQVKYVDVESLDKTGRSFRNLNRPEDII